MGDVVASSVIYTISTPKNKFLETHQYPHVQDMYFVCLLYTFFTLYIYH